MRQPTLAQLMMSYKQSLWLVALCCSYVWIEDILHVHHSLCAKEPNILFLLTLGIAPFTHLLYLEEALFWSNLKHLLLLTWPDAFAWKCQPFSDGGEGCYGDCLGVALWTQLKDHKTQPSVLLWLASCSADYMLMLACSTGIIFLEKKCFCLKI